MPVRRGKRWAAVVWDPARKAKRHLGTFDTKGQARDAEADFRLDRRTRAGGRETVRQFHSRWLDEYPRPKQSTNDHYAERIKPFVKDYGHVLMCDFDRVAARKIAKATPSVAMVARAMFTDWVSEQPNANIRNPFHQLRLAGTPGRKHIKPLTEKDIQTLDGLAQKKHGLYGIEYGAMIVFAGYTGIRPGELFALRRDDIVGDRARVERQYNRSGVDVPKNGKPREVVIPQPALEALERLRPYANGHLFCTATGRPFSQSSNWRYWNPVRCLFGREDLDWYELRHAAATLMLERGLSPWDVAIQLGHTDGGVLVMQRYGHPSHEEARKRVAEAFSGSSPQESPVVSVAKWKQEAS